MGKPFTNKSTFSILSTNPKLTGNVKLIVDSKENMFIETIDSTPELGRNKYKNKNINKDSSWENDVYSLFSNGQIPLDLFFSTVKDEFVSVSDKFSEQYFTNYRQGANYCTSKFYSENKSYFVPTWFEPNNIPEYFVILKVPGPISGTEETGIYNPNYLSITGLENTEDDTPNLVNGFFKQENDYFFQNILKNCQIVKFYSLKQGSNLGDYLRNYLLNTNFPESSLSVNWNKGEQSTVNGVSLRKGGFTKESFDLFTESFLVDRSVIEFDRMITNKFSENGVIHPNIINMEYLFDDNDDWQIGRYMGFYINEEQISKFKLKISDFYDKREQTPEQLDKIPSRDFIKIDKNETYDIFNTKGIKLFCDYPQNEYKVLGTDLKNRQYIPYIKGTKDNYFLVSNTVDWNTDEIVLKNTEVNLKEFIGFSTSDLGTISSALTNKLGRSYFTITLSDVVNSLEIRLREGSVINDTEFGLRNILIGSNTLEKGTFSVNNFSLNGDVSDILLSLSRCINNYSEENDDFNIYSVVKGNKIIIFTRGENEFWNRYKFLVYSSSQNSFDKILINDKSGNNVRPNDFVDYNKFIDNAFVYSPDLNIFYFTGTFKGGNNNEKGRVRVLKSDSLYFSENLYLKSKDWYTKINDISDYLDEPIFKKGRIVDFNNYNEYITINTSEDILQYENKFVKIYDLGFNSINLMSFYPVKDFDTDFFSKEYSRKIDGDFSEDNILYKSLVSLPNKTDGTLQKIDSEYDRLLENETPELSFSGRYVPIINKWVYDDNGLDVRENPYRLTTNNAFSFDNFTPSLIKKTADFRYYTHEWYYLGKFPAGDLSRFETYSYFNEDFDKSTFINNSYDYFSEYFTPYYADIVLDGNDSIKHKPVSFKYSNISDGTTERYCNTFFRGSKILVKKRTENSNLDFNVKNIKTLKNDFFNGYKFSAVLNDVTGANKVTYEIIENRKYKSIVFLIKANLLGYINNRYDFYKESFTTDENDTVTTLVRGGIRLSSETSSVYIFEGFANNGIGTSFNKDILPNDNGKFNNVTYSFEYDNDSYKVNISGDSIKSVTSNTIEVKNEPNNFTVIKNSTIINNIGLLGVNTFPEYTFIENSFLYETPVNGYLKSLIDELSFGNIVEKVNLGFSDIKYISILEDGTQIENDFILEFEKPSVNTKNNFLENSPIIGSSFNNLGFGVSGNNIIQSDTSLLVPMFNYNGRYNPKFKDVIYFRNTNELNPSFNIDTKKKIHLKNTEFFSSYEGFGLLKNTIIRKVNDIDAFSVLPDTIDLPRFFKVSEIPLDLKDTYIFRTNWDINYFRKYKLKNTFDLLPGYVEPKLVNNFFGTNILNIPNEINLENIEGKYISILRNDLVNLTLSIDLESVIKDLIKTKIQDLISTYVTTNVDDLDIYINSFIELNILQKYDLTNIEVFIKYTTKNIETELITSNKNKQNLIQEGFTKLSNFNLKKEEGSNFNNRFVFNKPSGVDFSLSFLAKITII